MRGGYRTPSDAHVPGDSPVDSATCRPRPPTSSRPPSCAALRARIAAAEPAFLADLERLVNLDCGSYTRDGVNEVATWVAAFLERLGGEVTRHPDPDGVLGDTVEAVFRGERRAARGRSSSATLDTVFPEGTAAERPFAIDDGIARGPGVTDMKSGLLTLLYGLEAALLRGRPAPVRAPDRHRQPRRGDRLAGLDPPHRAGRPRERRRLQPGVRPGQRRHRLVAQGDRRLRDHGRTAARPTPASSPRRGAARSSRRPTSSSASTGSTGAGRASPATSG